MGQTGKVELSASETEGGKWIEGSYHQIYRVVDGTVEDSRIAGCSSSKKEACLKQLPVGKYIVKSTYNEFKKETPLEIRAGETTKVHAIFNKYTIEAKCSNAGDTVSYEVYGSDGRMVADKKLPCSKPWSVVLDDGSYTVEARVDSSKKELQFKVGADQPNKLTIDLSNLNHEEEIKADTPDVSAAVPNTKQEQQNSEKITIGDKKIEIKGISEKDAAELKKAAAMLQMLGGMMQGGNTASSKEEKAKQDAKNTEADKEFEEMSKDLDMVTK